MNKMSANTLKRAQVKIGRVYMDIDQLPGWVYEWAQCSYCESWFEWLYWYECGQAACQDCREEHESECLKCRPHKCVICESFIPEPWIRRCGSNVCEECFSEHLEVCQWCADEALVNDRIEYGEQKYDSRP